VLVPPGKHEVTFLYRPRSLYYGAGVSGFALLSLALAMAREMLHRRRLARSGVPASSPAAEEPGEGPTP